MKINRLFALLLVFVMLFSIAMPALATESEAGADGMEPTEATQPEEIFETIYITNAEELLALAKNCRLDTWSVGKRVVLQQDISLEGVDFQPIPLFGGIFDGNGHTISGLYINESISPAGLIGRLQTTGIVMDLTVSGTVVPSGDAAFVGGIVGENYGLITDCCFTGSIMGDNSVGGIAGANTLTGKIINCETSGTVIGMDMTGGIAGANLGMIGSAVNKAYVNTVSIDPSVDPSEINFDFLTDISKLTSLDTSVAAMDTGGIAGYSSGILEGCTNKGTVGYPHVGYNVGGIAGRSCGYIHNCTNTSDIYGRKDVGGIVGQMEPYIAKNLTESTIAKLERQLDELDVLLDQAMSHADGAADSVVNRLNGIAGAAGAAGDAAQDIRTTGTITGNVSGSGESSADGGITVTPPQIEAGGDAGTGGSVNVEVSPGSGSIDIQTGSGGEIHAGLTEGGISGEGNTSGSGTVGAEAQISISTNLGGVASALYSLSGQMSMLSGELDGASDELNADVELIRAKINEITETGFELILGDGEEDVIIDSSELNIDLITLGKISDCGNSAAVQGDINVGGIAGAMAMEYELDPEDDISVSIDGSQRRKYEVKAVIHRCENTGNVICKRNYAGGITGKMDLGLIAGCESYGAVSSESGNYVGGIAGVGGSIIRHSFVKCTLSGGNYVGGIVGSGVNEDRSGESSTVAACYAIVTITDYKQYAGAISGGEAGTFLENYFVSEELAGINRMSYFGEAEPITYEEMIALFAVSEETITGEEATDSEGETEPTEPEIVVPPIDLPEEFRKFTLQFVVDGAVIDSHLFDYGTSFDDTVFPEIPFKEGCYAYWGRTDLRNLTFDTVVTAVYVPYVSALQSTEQRSNGRPVFFAEGDFDDHGTLSANTMALSAAEFDLADTVWDMILSGFTKGEVNTEVVEQWQLTLPEDDLESHTIRYLPPDGKEDRIDVYVLRGGVWEKVNTQVVGSYIAFPISEPTAQIAIVSTAQMGWVWWIVAFLVLVVLLLIIRLIRKICRRKKKAAPPPPKPAEESEEEIIRVPPPVKKRKPWLTVLLVVLALLVGIGGTAAFFLLPDLMAEKKAFELLKAYAEKPELSMHLTADATFGEEQIGLAADIDRTQAEGISVTMISEGGKSLYYADGTVILENGKAYALSAGFPNYAQLLELAMELYRHVDIAAVDGVYAITAQGADADAIIGLLIPAAELDIPKVYALQVKLITEGEEITAITFTGSGEGYAIDAMLEFLEVPREVAIPEAVLDTIQSGEYGSLEELSEDLFRLANAWDSVNSRDALSAELALSVDCGPLILNETVMLHRWNMDNSPVFCIEENGYALYFCDGTICDRNGNAVPVATVNTDAAQFLDLAYTASMNADAQCIGSGSRHTYTVTLAADGMEAVAYALAPEAKKLDIAFESGSIRVILVNNELESVSLSITGSVHVVLTKAEVSIGADLVFAENEKAPVLPEIVKTALQK